VTAHHRGRPPQLADLGAVVNLDLDHPPPQRLGVSPSCSPIRLHAPGRVLGFFRASTVRRIARSRSSSGYFRGAAMTLILRGLRASINAGARQTPGAWLRPGRTRPDVGLRGTRESRPLGCRQRSELRPM
jgi:hypothetical protein